MAASKSAAKPISPDTWNTTHCPQCGGRAVAQEGRTTFTNTNGTLCCYECLRKFEEKLYQQCPSCKGTGRVEREGPDVVED